MKSDSTEIIPKRGRSGSNPKPKKLMASTSKTDQVGKGMILVVQGRIHVAAVFDLDNPSPGGYSRSLEAVTKRFLESGNIKVDDIASYLIFVRCMYQGRFVDVLVCMDQVKCLGVKAGAIFVVLEKEDEFAEVGKILKEKEGLNPEEFLYFFSSINYPLGMILVFLFII